ncbi:thioredoxin family protein [Chengkuizengella marina]|uniref:Thioredoxin n=1 Tax=Chengkuizengella marina TaxID=2507566 RepID=A0A6N9PY21_9BACL|nr:thioredoxin family protein [Chengkuizengella marina]NBI28421.1 thioredoxin [Chengkuizengella marina]
MKKLIIYSSIVIVLIASLYFVNQLSENQAYAKYEKDAERLYQTSPKDLKPETRKQLDDENYQNIILPDQFQEMKENGESFYVYFFSPTCPVCEYTTPVLNPIVEEVGVELYQYNVWEFEQGWEFIDVTPTIIYYEDGEYKGKVEGGFKTTSDAKAAEYRQFFSTNN